VIPLRWTEQAVDDLREIRKYIERDSPRYSRLVVERLYEATQRLETFPRSGISYGIQVFTCLPSGELGRVIERPHLRTDGNMGISGHFYGNWPGSITRA